MRLIGLESRLIELSNGSRIASFRVRTKPGRAREVGIKTKEISEFYTFNWLTHFARPVEAKQKVFQPVDTFCSTG